MVTVTAVVPSFNHAPYIEERILSILSQTGAEIRLIVIDDHSTDESDDIIRRIRDQHRFEYIRRDENSGTPFAAWEEAARSVDCDFIWICESDDVAAADFLSTALACFAAAPNAALYYCNSDVIDESGIVIGNTASYFADIWKDPRWLKSFWADGREELAGYQYRGMTVPNMSSALIRRAAFSDAYSPSLKRFALTGDWLFVGQVMLHGDVLFDVSTHNQFRRHAQTAREKTNSGRSQAEFIITKYRLHRLAGKPIRQLVHTLRLDATRFLYEPASPSKVVRELWRMSWTNTLSLALALPYSLLFYPGYVRKFFQRLRSRRASSG